MTSHFLLYCFNKLQINDLNFLICLDRVYA
jgi:hypothetical protein